MGKRGEVRRLGVGGAGVLLVWGGGEQLQLEHSRHDLAPTAWLPKRHN